MAIITRISRLFKADFHAVLDQVEEPHILLKQAIRDMEDELTETDVRHRQTLGHANDLTSRREQLERSLVENEEQLDVCFESNEEGLARDQIKRKLQTQRLLNHLNSRLGAAEKDSHRLSKSLEENRATLESLRQKADLFEGHSSPAYGDQTAIDDCSWNARELSVSDSDVEVALLREKKRRAAS